MWVFCVFCVLRPVEPDVLCQTIHNTVIKSFRSMLKKYNFKIADDFSIGKPCPSTWNTVRILYAGNCCNIILSGEKQGSPNA